MRKWVLAFCLGAGAASADVPKVAVDIAPVHSILAAVMGDLGQPDLIIAPGASPHGYSLRPSEARALDQADVVVWMGDALTPWLAGPIAGLAGNATVLELLDAPETQLLDVRDGAAFETDHDHHDHGHDDNHGDDHGDDHADDHSDDHADDHGENHADDHSDDHDGHDDHGASDPHAWLDPQNAVAWAGIFAKALGEKDPENAQTYAKNAKAFGLDINALQAKLDASLASVRGQPFVVFHDAYHYFEHRFEIEAVGAVSSTDAAAPSPARVAELRDEVAELGAVCALTEPQFNPGILDALGATKLGEVDPLGSALPLGPDLYAALLQSMSTSLSNCLK